MHRTEIEREFLAAKGFNTNLVQFLQLHRVDISDVHVCTFTCVILCARNLVHKKL